MRTSSPYSAAKFRMKPCLAVAAPGESSLKRAFMTALIVHFASSSVIERAFAFSAESIAAAASTDTFEASFEVPSILIANDPGIS